LQAIAGYDARDPGSVPAAIPDYASALDTGVKGLRVGVLRHYWEEDMQTHPDLARALEEAIAVFRSLGAHVEDCRTRPLADSFEVKIIVGESEIYAIHYDNLKSRPGDFGRDFLGRILPACLFAGPDYVQASREHRRIIAEAQPLHDRYDVLLTAGLGPAPRFDAHRTRTFWLKPTDLFRPSNLTGAPALVLPVGWSGGLPLGLQLVGRPFDDATVLRTGHAFQKATDWHTRRPTLVPGAKQPAISQESNEPAVPADLDGKTRDFALETAARAGLKLDERQQTILLEGALPALAMVERIRKARERMETPAYSFRLPH
jgi:aspartyl-tRNA(Asn)/glutamyl-tRNA(Gln) amidotransferase subunit A